MLHFGETYDFPKISNFVGTKPTNYKIVGGTVLIKFCRSSKNYQSHNTVHLKDCTVLYMFLLFKSFML
jgi:hypothetical protein